MKFKPKKPIGAPSKYSDRMADKITSFLMTRGADGNPGTLYNACKAANINEATAFRWMARHEEFRKLYAHACEVRSHMLAEDTGRVADDLSEAPDSRRVRIDQRKWYAAKLNPKTYSDKVQTDTTLHAGDTLVALMGRIDGKTRSPVSED